MASVENDAQMTENNLPTAVKQRKPDISSYDKAKITDVSVLLPLKNDFFLQHPEIILGSLGNRQSSTSSSCSSRRRLDLEAEILEGEANAEIEKNQQELEL